MARPSACWARLDRSRSPSYDVLTFSPRVQTGLSGRAPVAPVPPVDYQEGRFRHGVRRLLRQVPQEADRHRRRRSRDGQGPANGKGPLPSVWDNGDPLLAQREEVRREPSGNSIWPDKVSQALWQLRPLSGAELLLLLDEMGCMQLRPPGGLSLSSMTRLIHFSDLLGPFIVPLPPRPHTRRPPTPALAHRRPGVPRTVRSPDFERLRFDQVLELVQATGGYCSSQSAPTDAG